MHIRRPGGYRDTWMNIPGDRLLEPAGCTLVLATTWSTVNTKVSQRVLGDGEGRKLIGGKSIALSTSVARQGSKPHPKVTIMSFSLCGHRPRSRMKGPPQPQRHRSTWEHAEYWSSSTFLLLLFQVLTNSFPCPSMFLF